jgi:DNA-binding GntR family transcriptional regulator
MSLRGRKAPDKARGNNSSKVAGILRDKILHLKLRPGEVIDEAALASELGVSRTPMREALIRLAADNLVELTPNRGARVTTINLPDIRELFEVLEVVQGITTRWAALRRDDEEILQMRMMAREFHKHIGKNDMLAAVQANFDLHTGIARAAKNNLFVNFYSSLLSRTFRLGIITLTVSTQPQTERLQDYRSIETEHDELIHAIERREGEKAESLARQHARNFLLRVSRYTSENIADQAGCYDPQTHNATPHHRHSDG